MKLWTWHKPEFSLTEDAIDRSRSDCYNNPSLCAEEAYEKMGEKLGTNQLIWCFLKSTDEHIFSDQIRVQWELNVSEPTKTNPTPRIYDSKRWDDIVQKRLPLEDELPVEDELPEALFLEDVSNPNASVIIQPKDILSVEKSILWLRSGSKISLTDNFLGLNKRCSKTLFLQKVFSSLRF